MLNYFLSKYEIPEVREAVNLINDVKEHLISNDYNIPYPEEKIAGNLFEKIRSIAVQMQDEKFANSQFVTSVYFSIFCELGKYFSLLSKREYRISWDCLQDCIDTCHLFCKFTEPDERHEVPDVLDLLHKYEKLYPFTLFLSTELQIKKSICSICGKSMQGFDCPHIPGNLYWGKMAVRTVTDVVPLRAISLVYNPADKRCVVGFKEDDKRTDDEKYYYLCNYLNQHIPYLQKYRVVKEEIRKIRNESIQIVGRNDFCPCGSGKKFKKCCLSKLYYKQHHQIIEPGGIVILEKIAFKHQ